MEEGDAKARPDGPRRIAFTCAHCQKPFTRTRREASKCTGEFCSHHCSTEAKRGRPIPGFITPTSTKAERLRANGLINMRLRKGWFVRPTHCMKCREAKKRLDAHHPNYAKPDEVLWLCRSCHVYGHSHPETIAGIAPFVCDDQRVAGGASF